MKQEELDKLVETFNTNNPDYVGFCDGFNEMEYNGYISVTTGNPIRGEKENWEPFVKWLKETKNLTLDPIVAFNVWSKHSNDYHADYLFLPKDNEKVWEYLEITLSGIEY